MTLRRKAAWGGHVVIPIFDGHISNFKWTKVSMRHICLPVQGRQMALLRSIQQLTLNWRIRLHTNMFMNFIDLLSQLHFKTGPYTCKIRSTMSYICIYICNLYFNIWYQIIIDLIKSYVISYIVCLLWLNVRVYILCSFFSSTRQRLWHLWHYQYLISDSNQVTYPWGTAQVVRTVTQWMNPYAGHKRMEKKVKQGLIHTL